MYYLTIILFLFTIFLTFNFNNAYADNSLSFDQNRIVIEHSGIISCYNCTNANDAPTMTVTLTGPSVPGGQSYVLYKVSTNNYESSLIKFTTSSSSEQYFLTAVGQVINVTAPGFTQSSATIFSTTASLPVEYKKDKKMISPSNPDCNNYGGDTDGDWICNDWENNSNYPSQCNGPGLCVRTSSSVIPYYLACNPNSSHWSDICPSPTKADLYYEFDWMLGHKPSNDVIDAVNSTLANSNYVSLNGIQGITFHAQLSEELPHVDQLRWTSSKFFPGFDQLKYWWYGTTTERGYTVPTEITNGDWNNSKRSQKAQVVHYLIFTHQQYGAAYLPNSGIAEMPGNDALVSLGAFDGKVGTKNQQKATLLHEIGHNINLDHGGNDPYSCKPNYLSVMNPMFQMDSFGANRPLDFSRSQLNQLDETALSESDGIVPSTPPGLNSTYGPNPPLVRMTGQGFDWNRDGSISGTVTADISFIPTISLCPSSPGQLLTGFKDWDRNTMKLSPLGHGTNSQEDLANLFLSRAEKPVNDGDTTNFTFLVDDELQAYQLEEGITQNVPSGHIICDDGFVNLFQPNVTAPFNEFGGCFKDSESNLIKLESWGWKSPN